LESPKWNISVFIPEADLEQKVREYATEKIAASIQAADKQVREENNERGQRRCLRLTLLKFSLKEKKKLKR
jgi:hypothetical protein